MILTFPDLDTLRLALTTGAVPPAVSLAPAAAGWDGQGRLWLRPSVDLPRSAQNELRRLGVQVAKAEGTPLSESVTCWPQLLPLLPGELKLARPEQTPVLFDLPGEQLASLVGEVLRLGNDRQTFRWLEAGDGSARALLRVVGPPYYSLLRAIDRDGQAAAPLAHVECAPRVWVQLGYTLPLGEQLKPPPGKLLLVRSPRQWLFLDDGPFRDIYEVLEFGLPNVPSPWSVAPFERRLEVPLRLSRSGPEEAAELWVLRDRPLEQLDALVSGSDDHLLRQLSFAV